MRLEQLPDKRSVVHFSPSEVKAIGLPSKPCSITYDKYCRLDDYSQWLQSSKKGKDLIDQLFALADSMFERICNAQH